MYIIDQHLNDKVVELEEDEDDIYLKVDGWYVIALNKETGNIKKCVSVGEDSGLEIDEHERVVIH